MADRRPDAAEILAVALRHAARPGDAEHPDDGTFHRYLARELPGDENEAFERHAASCESCAADLSVLTRVEEDAAGSVFQAGPERSSSRPARSSATSTSSSSASSPWSAPRPSAVALPKRERGSRGWWRIAAGIALFVGALALARAGGRMAAARLEPLVLTGLAEATGREVSAGGFSLLLASGPGVEVDDLRLSDDPRFSEDDLLTIGSAVVRLEPGALLRGELRGNLLLERPVLRLVQDPSGLWNIETIGGREPGDEQSRRLGRSEELERALEDAKRSPDGEEEKASPIQLTSASIRAGTLEITRGNPDSQGLTLSDVDASYTARAGTPANLSLEGRVGSEGHRVVLRGEIGPFGGDAMPRYRLEDVSLERVPLREIPGAPDSMQGELSFTGRLDSAGRALDPIVRAAHGDGDLDICCGALEERNLANDVLTGVTDSGRGLDPQAKTILSAALERAALADALAGTSTPFERLGGHVEVRSGNLDFDALVLETSLFVANVRGSLALEGTLDASGEVELSPELAQVVLAAVPELRALGGRNGTLELPFQASGSWPDLSIGIDAERVAAVLAPRTLAGEVFALLARGPSFSRAAS